MKNIFSLSKNPFPVSPANTPEPAVAMTAKSGLSPEFIDYYGLSRRQADVTEIILLGKSDREIAALLEIGLNTVKTHLKHIYKKTGVRSRCALMVLVGDCHLYLRRVV